MQTNKEIRRTIYTDGLRIRTGDDGQPSRAITGYAIMFNSESAPLYDDGKFEDREVISPEAVSRDLLDRSDILMTLFHDRQLILARSRAGAGTLSYFIDDTGVGFQFDAPNTADGDKALELVRRGDITGCSFAFTTYYSDPDYVSVSREKREGKTVSVHTVNRMTGIYDFTLTPDPAYPDTSCEARELFRCLHEEEREEEPQSGSAAGIAAQIARMRDAAKIINV